MYGCAALFRYPGGDLFVVLLGHHHITQEKLTLLHRHHVLTESESQMQQELQSVAAEDAATHVAIQCLKEVFLLLVHVGFNFLKISQRLGKN